MNTKTKKILWGIVSLFICAFLACGVLLVQYINNPSPAPEASAPVVDENGNALNGDTVHQMPKAMIFSSTTALSSGITVNATVKPDTAANKAVDWAVSFANPESAWATGKTVTNYVTVTPSADGSTTATVNCLEAFGEQIIVKVTSRANELATASMTVDYREKITAATFNFCNISQDLSSYDGRVLTLNNPANMSDSGRSMYDIWNNSKITFDFTYSIGTVESRGGTFSPDFYIITFADAILTQLRSSGFSIINGNTFHEYVDVLNFYYLIEGILLNNGDLIEVVEYGPKPITYTQIKAEAWNLYAAAIRANTAEYDFMIEIPSIDECPGVQIKLKLDRNSISQLAESIELDNTAITF